MKWVRDFFNPDSSGSARQPSLTLIRSSLAKRALLRHMTRLCIFFGKDLTESFFLPLFLTIINERDWELRHAFYEHIPELCAYLGPAATEMIMPLFDGAAIFDLEELVVARALRCLSAARVTHGPDSSG